MEGAPLSLAYTHARNAAQETQRANPVAASEEHDLAAAEFAAAAQNTTDKEALRVLKLLEAHHRQLGQILKDTHSAPAKSGEGQKDQISQTRGVEQGRDKDKSIEAGIHPPRLSRTGRSAGRDLSSSIASNLASARGIPNAKQKRNLPVSPLVSNEHADGTFTQDSPDQRRRAPTRNPSSSSSRPSWTPPESIVTNTKTDPAVTDAPFQQFYSKFEGLLSTLTAPLAFASLPLGQPAHKNEVVTESVASPSQQSKNRPTKPDVPSSNLDYSSLISQAALRAVRDNNPSLKPHESFIHVPTSGGTMSYADITAQAYIDRQLSRQDHAHAHAHARNPSSHSNEDFVDASSQILPDGRIFGTGAQPKHDGKTMEELALENTVLKRTTNDMARRLMIFESNAQNSSAALAQSIRSLHLSPVTTPENSRGKMIAVSGGHSNDVAARMAQKRIEELEEGLRKYDRKLNKREDENAKLKETLARYREKWEGLKAGAKARREQAGAGTGGAERTRKSSGQAVGTTGGQATVAAATREADGKGTEE